MAVGNEKFSPISIQDAGELHPDLQLAIRQGRIDEQQALRIHWYVEREFPQAEEIDKRAIYKRLVYQYETGQYEADIARQKKSEANEQEEPKTTVIQPSAVPAEQEGRGRLRQAAVNKGEELAKQVAKKAFWNVVRTIVLMVMPWVLGAIGVIFLVAVIMISLCKFPGASVFLKYCGSLEAGSLNMGGNVSPSGYSDGAVRERLAQALISVNNPEPRTSLAGMQERTIQEIIDFKNACDAWAGRNGRGSCTVVVTGGTEPGHASGTCSHANGFKFDLRLNDNVNSFIRTSGQFEGNRPRGSNPGFIRRGRGSYYVNEPNHWDIAVACSSLEESEDTNAHR